MRFVTSLQAIFAQDRLNVLKLTKNISLKKFAQKSQQVCKTTSATKWPYRIFEILSFNLKVKKKTCFWTTYKNKVFGVKTENMLWRPVFAMPMPNFEALRQFLVTELPKKRENSI